MTAGKTTSSARSWNSGKTRSLVLASVFSSLIAIGAFIRIPLPFLSFSLQTLFLALASIVLNRKWALISVLVYIAVGLAGFPVFSTGGGIGYILQPSFGFLLGFLLWVFIAGTLNARLKKKTTLRLWAVQILGVLAMYGVALPYYDLIMRFYQGDPMSAAALFTYCFAATCPGDILKAWLASWIGSRMAPQLRQQGRNMI